MWRRPGQLWEEWGNQKSMIWGHQTPRLVLKASHTRAIRMFVRVLYPETLPTICLHEKPSTDRVKANRLGPGSSSVHIPRAKAVQ